MIKAFQGVKTKEDLAIALYNVMGDKAFMKAFKRK